MFDFDATTRADGNVVAPTTDVNLSRAFGLTDRSRPSEEQIRRQLRGTLDACLRTRAKLFARSALPTMDSEGFRVMRMEGGEMEPVSEDHPWVRILRQPNNYRSAYDTWYWARMAADVQGTAPFVVRDDGLGTPDALLEVFPSFGKMRERINREGGVDGYVYHRRDGQRVPLGQNDVVALKRTDPTEPHATASILESLIYEVSSDRAAAEYRQKTYSEGRPPLLYMSTDQDMNADTASEQGQRFKNEYMRPNGEVKGVPVMYGGMDLESLGIDPDTFQMLESQELDHDVIFRVTGVNSAYLDQGSNRAEAEQAEKSILRGTIQPLLTQAAYQLTISLERAFGADEGQLRVLPPDVRPSDPEQDEIVRRKRIERGVPPAVIMEEEGEEVPDEYEDELRRPHVPNTLRPVGQEPQGPPRDFL